MIKNLFKIFVTIAVLFVLLIGYFSYFGFTTSKFNSIIKDQIKNQNSGLDIDLNKVKLHLDIKNISIKIKTKNPKIKLNNSETLELNEISSNISIFSYIQNKFAIDNLSIETKDNKINTYINFYKLINNNLQLVLLNQFIKKGNAQIDIDLYFDEVGKIKNNYSLSGKIRNAAIRLPKHKNIEELNFSFNVINNNFRSKKIFFNFYGVKFNSEFLNIKKENNKFHVNGNLKSKKNKINKDLILLIFKNTLEDFDYSKSNIDSFSEFTFYINNKFKIKDLKLDSKLNLDKLIIKKNIKNIKSYFKDYNNQVELKENKFHIKFEEKETFINGSSEFYIEKNNKNLINFQVIKNNNKINFETFLNLKNIDINLKDIGYSKAKNNKATLNINGFGNDGKIFFNNINFQNIDNQIEIANLEINNKNILNLDKIKFDFLTVNNFKNQITLIKKKNDYVLKGKSFDSMQLIENVSNSEPGKNFFEIFENLNTKVKIDIDEVKLDNENTVNILNGNLEIKNSNIFNLYLNSNFSNIEKLLVSVKTQNDNSIVTALYSDRAKPFVKKYKFIKGFKGGNLDFSSTKINNVSKSKLIIDNFKIQEVTEGILGKILTLASLQGIADLLTGEGVRFTDFEMIYSNKGSLMTIDEMYAIGPAISIMMEGYVEGKNLVSLRGTLVPATTINRTISSIKWLGDLLVGKKVGDGVFGVSFKIKGPPKNLKTRVNPIKTLTPRFITRTLEKIKKN